jgi:hypothetical protein
MLAQRKRRLRSLMERDSIIERGDKSVLQSSCAVVMHRLFRNIQKFIEKHFYYGIEKSVKLFGSQRGGFR